MNSISHLHRADNNWGPFSWERRMERERKGSEFGHQLILCNKRKGWNSVTYLYMINGIISRAKTILFFGCHASLFYCATHDPIGTYISKIVLGGINGFAMHTSWIFSQISVQSLGNSNQRRHLGGLGAVAPSQGKRKKRKKKEKREKKEKKRKRKKGTMNDVKLLHTKCCFFPIFQ